MGGRQPMTTTWPTDNYLLLPLAVARMKKFCVLHKLPIPMVRVRPKDEWDFSVCAYYRPEIVIFSRQDRDGVNICLDKCAVPCGENVSRNWSWPGNTVDRTAYGVVGHELGHHVDWTLSANKAAYYGDFSKGLPERLGAKPISGYADGDHEIFAEWFRVFFTNPDLLKYLRPSVYDFLCGHFPVRKEDYEHWADVIGCDAPRRIGAALLNKCKELPLCGQIQFDDDGRPIK